MKIHNIPSIGTYGNYSSSNYGAHALVVTIGPITIWFSYHTPIAFRAPGCPRIVRQNDWSTTTGKHLNAIDGGNKKSRVTSERFEELWKQHVESLFNEPAGTP